MRSLPADYPERAYAAVLGKLIGVYLGRPFENWTYRRIVRDLGPIEYYVHDRLDCPLVVTDDDVAGTFTFIRALEEHGANRRHLVARDRPDVAQRDRREPRHPVVGRTGNSTEHTAWLNLKRGVHAPESGSIEVNGRTVAEQIGAQIFIDGWAIVAAGDPALAARLAEQAARVSHDGAAVEAAKLWAAMEAEAFVSRDMQHVIDVGLSQIAPSSPIARLVADVRDWRRRYADWRDTREEIERRYGYDKYPGNCHVVPNHALMIMAALYAPDDFSLAQTIVCTSGWDTDCNAGNVGCLMGAMLGLEGLEAGKDWRGPLADRMLISSADGGFAINDAVRVSERLVNLGHGSPGCRRSILPRAARNSISPDQGSVQGFMPSANARRCSASPMSTSRRPRARAPLRRPRRRTRRRADADLRAARRHAHAHLRADGDSARLPRAMGQRARDRSKGTEAKSTSLAHPRLRPARRSARSDRRQLGRPPTEAKPCFAGGCRTPGDSPSSPSALRFVPPPAARAERSSSTIYDGTARRTFVFAVPTSRATSGDARG